MRFPRLLKLTEVPLLLGDVPLSTFVSVGSVLKGIGCRVWGSDLCSLERVGEGACVVGFRQLWEGSGDYRGTSLIRNTPLLGP